VSQPRAAGSWSLAAASTSGTWASAASKRVRVPRAARAVGHLQHMLDASAVETAGVQEDLCDRTGGF